VHASTRRGEERTPLATRTPRSPTACSTHALVAAARLNGRFQTVKGALRERERDATQLVENDVGAAELERAHEQLDKVF